MQCCFQLGAVGGETPTCDVDDQKFRSHLFVSCATVPVPDTPSSSWTASFGNDLTVDELSAAPTLSR